MQKYVSLVVPLVNGVYYKNGTARGAINRRLVSTKDRYKHQVPYGAISMLKRSLVIKIVDTLVSSIYCILIISHSSPPSQQKCIGSRHLRLFKVSSCVKVYHVFSRCHIIYRLVRAFIIVPI